MFVYLGFYEEESRFSVFVVLREEGGGRKSAEIKKDERC